MMARGPRGGHTRGLMRQASRLVFRWGFFGVAAVLLLWVSLLGFRRSHPAQHAQGPPRPPAGGPSPAVGPSLLPAQLVNARRGPDSAANPWPPATEAAEVAVLSPHDQAVADLDAAGAKHAETFPYTKRWPFSRSGPGHEVSVYKPKPFPPEGPARAPVPEVTRGASEMAKLAVLGHHSVPRYNMRGQATTGRRDSGGFWSRVVGDDDDALVKGAAQPFVARGGGGRSSASGRSTPLLVPRQVHGGEKDDDDEAVVGVQASASTLPPKGRGGGGGAGEDEDEEGGGGKAVHKGTRVRRMGREESEDEAPLAGHGHGNHNADAEEAHHEEAEEGHHGRGGHGGHDGEEEGEEVSQVPPHSSDEDKAEEEEVAHPRAAHAHDGDEEAEEGHHEEAEEGHPAAAGGHRGGEEGPGAERAHGAHEDEGGEEGEEEGGEADELGVLGRSSARSPPPPSPRPPKRRPPSRAVARDDAAAAAMRAHGGGDEVVVTASGRMDRASSASTLSADDPDEEDDRRAAEPRLEDSPEEKRVREVCDYRCREDRKRRCRATRTGDQPGLLGFPTHVRDWYRVRRTEGIVPSDFFASSSLEDRGGTMPNWKALRRLLPARGEDVTRGKNMTRCAVVGNSGGILMNLAGPAIDAHDVVFRINQAPTGYQRRAFGAHVGKKTTFRVLNHIWSKAYSYATGRLPLERNSTLVVSRCGAQETVENTARMIRRWGSRYRLPRNRHDVAVMNVRFVTLTRVLESAYAECLELAGRPPAKGKGVPSTGLVTVFGAMSMCKEVTVYGFGAAPPGVPYQYYEQRTNGDPTHSFGTEEALLKALARASHLTLCSAQGRCVRGRKHYEMPRSKSAPPAPKKKKTPAPPPPFSGSGRFHGNPLKMFNGRPIRLGPPPPPPPPKTRGVRIAVDEEEDFE